jgi:hypothetical protein
MDISAFQKKWGVQWASLVKSEMFSDALEAVAGTSRSLRIKNLDDQKIKDFAEIILSRQQGFVEFSELLQTLHNRPSLDGFARVAEEYPDPITEAHQEHERIRNGHNSGDGAGDANSSPKTTGRGRQKRG